MFLGGFTCGSLCCVISIVGVLLMYEVDITFSQPSSVSNVKQFSVVINLMAKILLPQFNQRPFF